MTDRPRGADSAARRWAWFLGLWLAGVAAVSGLAYGIKFLIGI